MSTRTGKLLRAHPAGTVSWQEHEKTWVEYAKKYGSSQSAEWLAERGGFSYWEMAGLLGHEPKTWSPRGKS